MAENCLSIGHGFHMTINHLLRFSALVPNTEVEMISLLGDTAPLGQMLCAMGAGGPRDVVRPTGPRGSRFCFESCDGSSRHLLAGFYEVTAPCGWHSRQPSRGRLTGRVLCPRSLGVSSGWGSCYQLLEPLGAAQRPAQGRAATKRAVGSTRADTESLRSAADVPAQN